MVRNIASWTVISILAATLAACDKPGQAETQKETKAVEQANNAKIEAEQRAQNAQATADKDIVAARADFAKVREDYLHTRRLDLVALDTRVFGLESKARTTTGKAKADLESRLSAVRAERETFAHHLQSLETSAAANWDAAKANLDKDWETLKAAVDKAAD